MQVKVISPRVLVYSSLLQYPEFYYPPPTPNKAVDYHIKLYFFCASLTQVLQSILGHPHSLTYLLTYAFGP